MKQLTVLLVVLGLLLGSITVASAQSKQKAPTFTLKTQNGKTFDLSKMKGKVVLVNFWATWCGPCRREIPDFIDVYGKYKSKGLEIVGVSLDAEGWDVVNPFLQKYAITYPIVIGGEELSNAYGSIQAIPTTFIVDKNGYVVDRHIGMMTKSQLESKLKGLL